jgi:hypothetical protein
MTPPFGAEIDGVGEQVVEDDQQLVAVERASDRRRLGQHRQLARLDLQLAALDDIGEQLLQLQRPVGQAAGLEARGIEAQQAFDVPLQVMTLCCRMSTTSCWAPSRGRPPCPAAARRLHAARSAASSARARRGAGALAFRFEFAQALPQPVQPAPDPPQVGRAAPRTGSSNRLSPRRSMALVRCCVIGRDSHQLIASATRKAPPTVTATMPGKLQAVVFELRQPKGILLVDPQPAGVRQFTVDLGKPSQKR